MWVRLNWTAGSEILTFFSVLKSCVTFHSVCSTQVRSTWQKPTKGPKACVFWGSSRSSIRVSDPLFVNDFVIAYRRFRALLLICRRCGSNSFWYGAAREKPTGTRKVAIQLDRGRQPSSLPPLPFATSSTTPLIPSNTGPDGGWLILWVFMVEHELALLVYH